MTKLAEMSDANLKSLLKEFQHLQKEGVLPENSEWSKISTEICTAFNVSYDLKLTESFVMTELINRFVNSEKEFTAEQAEDMAMDFGLLAVGNEGKKLPDGPWRFSFRDLVLKKYRK